MIVAATFGLVVWVVLWSIGAKGFDAFMVTAFVILLGAAGRILARYLLSL